MGVCPIKNAEIAAWLDIHSIYDSWMRRDVYTAVRALDAVWRDKIVHQSKEQKQLPAGK